MSQPSASSFGWFLGVATLATVGTAALLAVPAWLWTGREGLVAVGVALCACWLGSLAGRAAQHGILKVVDTPERGVHAMLGALGVRMFVTLVVALVVVLIEPFELLPFAIWLLVGYLALLCLEVFVAVREFGQNHRPIRSSEGSEAPAEGDPSNGEA